MYIPKSTTTTTGSSSGIGLNVGAVTGALGIGGVVGQLANGVNVGAGGNSSLTNTVYSQRVLSVPPHGTIQLPFQYLWGESEQYFFNGFELKAVFGTSSNDMRTIVYFPSNSPKGKLLNGQEIMYSPENSPINLSMYVSYSYTEDCKSQKTIPVNLYLQRIVGYYATINAKRLIDVQTGAKIGWVTYINDKQNMKEFFRP